MQVINSRPREVHSRPRAKFFLIRTNQGWYEITYLFFPWNLHKSNFWFTTDTEHTLLLLDLWMTHTTKQKSHSKASHGLNRKISIHFGKCYHYLLVFDADGSSLDEWSVSWKTGPSNGQSGRVISHDSDWKKMYVPSLKCHTVMNSISVIIRLSYYHLNSCRF